MERPKSSGARPRSSGTRPNSPPKKPGSGAPLPTSGAQAVEELNKKIALLEAQRNEEMRARNLAQLERYKIQTFWDITKRELEEARGAARLAARGLEKAQDAHALELKVYRQKVKHLLFEHQFGVDKLKAAGEAALAAQAAHFGAQEAELGSDKRSLLARIREQDLSNEELVKQFRIDNAKQVAKLRQEFELQVRQVQQKYEAQLKELEDSMEKQHSTEVAAVEQRRAAHVSELMAAHKAAFRDLRAYYQQIASSNLDLIKELREEMADMKRTEAKQDKLVAEVTRENKRLTQPLAKALAEAEALRAALAGTERDRAALAATKARLAASERAVKGLEWECEVLRQRCEAAEGQNAALQAAFHGAVADAAQRSGLRAALLERKLSAVSAAATPARSGSMAEAGARRLGTPGGARSSRGSSRAGTAQARSELASPNLCALTVDAGLLPAGLPHEPADALSAEQQSKQQQQEGGSAAAALPPVGSAEWALAVLAAALKTPLPDPDAAVIEDEEAGAILGQLDQIMGAADDGGLDAAPVGKDSSSDDLGAGAGLLAAKLALGAEHAAADVDAIPAVRVLSPT